MTKSEIVDQFFAFFFSILTSNTEEILSNMLMNLHDPLHRFFSHSELFFLYFSFLLCKVLFLSFSFLFDFLIHFSTSYLLPLFLQFVLFIFPSFFHLPSNCSFSVYLSIRYHLFLFQSHLFLSLSCFWRDHTFNPAGTQGAFKKISSQAGGRLSF